MADDAESVYTGADDAEEVEDDEQLDDTLEEEAPPQSMVKRVVVVPSAETTDRLSLAEQTELISVRIAQLQRNPTVMPGVDITGLSDPADIAKREFNARKCPLKVRRTLGTRTVEGEEVEYVTYVDPKHPDCIYAKIYNI